MSVPVLQPQQIRVGARVAGKEDAIREAHSILVAAGAVTDDYLQAMRDREASVSTYMGNFLAIPHGTNESKESILRSALSFVRYDEPIDWDGNPVRFVVGIAGVGDEHLEILSRIAVIFSDEDEVAELLAAGDAREVYEKLSAVNEGSG